MFLFTLLIVLMLAALIQAAILALAVIVGVFGMGWVIILIDVVVCVGILTWIVCRITKKSGS